MPVQTQMQVRRGTASSWTSTNPTLAAGELGFETDTGKFKIGTGSSTWTALSYAGGGQNTLTTYQYTATAVTLTISSLDVSGSRTTMKSSVVLMDAALIPPRRLVALTTVILVADVVKEPTTSVSSETLERPYNAFI